MMTIKAIIFDWGRVLGLFDHMVTCRELTKYSAMTAKEIHTTILKSGIERNFDAGLITPEVFYVRVCQAIGVDQNEMNIQQLKTAWQSTIQRDNSDIKPVLERIRPVIKLLLLSNTNIWHWEAMCNLSFVRDFLYDGQRRMVLSFMLYSCKPEEGIYRRAVERSGFFINELVYVDDVLEYAAKFGQMGGHFINYDCTRMGSAYLAHELKKLDLLM